MRSQRRVVFLCTGNYYRSRYAEIYFNASALAQRGWHAVSRGFRLSPENSGPIALCVLDRLRHRRIALPDPIRAPRQLQAQDLLQSDRVIALDEAEHRPYLEQDLPAWRERVVYWHVPDVDGMAVDQALWTIEEEVENLLRRLIR